MRQIAASMALLSATSPLAHAAAASAAAPGADAPPKNAKPMTVSELYTMYRDKTWLWRDGGAYFASDGQFAAWWEQGGEARFADGRWWVAATDGRMCFQALWRSAKAADRHRDCFDHLAAGDVIFQRREPAGPWYRFKSSPSVAGDEFQALKPGNLVSENIKRLRAPIATGKPPPKGAAS